MAGARAEDIKTFNIFSIWLLQLQVMSAIAAAIPTPQIRVLAHDTPGSWGHRQLKSSWSSSSSSFSSSSASLSPSSRKEVPELLIGDEVISPYRNAVRDKSRRWPGGVIPYVIDSHYSKEYKAIILAAMSEIEVSVGTDKDKCIQFVPRTSQTNYLEVYLGTGCHSPIGFLNNAVHKATLGKYCAIKGVVIHELLHVLGFYHEQNRPDRDKYVNINTTNISEKAKRDFRIRNDTVIDDLGVPYDFSSVMHYGPYTMAENDAYPALTPTPQYAQGLRMGQRFGLSTGDVLKVQRLYECPEDTTHLVSDINKVLAQCDFHNGTCGFTVEASAPVQWLIATGSTPMGPKAGNTNGLDPYLYASPDEAVMARLDKQSESLQASSPTTRAPTVSRTPTTGVPILTPPTSPNIAQPVSSSVPPPSPSQIPRFTTSVITPLVKSLDSDLWCLMFSAYQRGPQSFVAVYVSGPLITRQIISTYDGVYNDFWAMVRSTISINKGVEFRLEVMADLTSGAVALDDFFLLSTSC